MKLQQSIRVNKRCVVCHYWQKIAINYITTVKGCFGCPTQLIDAHRIRK